EKDGIRYDLVTGVQTCALPIFAGRRNGVLISNDQGEAVAYALWNLEDRGPMMIEPGCKVYRGMIVGEHTRGNDLDVNVLKGKKRSEERRVGKGSVARGGEGREW